LSGRSKGIFVIFRILKKKFNHGTPMWVLVHPRPCLILEGKKGEKQFNGVSNWNAQGIPFFNGHFIL
jgi:hypothetical protein